MLVFIALLQSLVTVNGFLGREEKEAAKAKSVVFHMLEVMSSDELLNRLVGFKRERTDVFLGLGCSQVAVKAFLQDLDNWRFTAVSRICRLGSDILDFAINFFTVPKKLSVEKLMEILKELLRTSRVTSDYPLYNV